MTASVAALELALDELQLTVQSLQIQLDATSASSQELARLKAENDRLRTALVRAEKQTEAALHSLARVSNQLAEFKASHHTNHLNLPSITVTTSTCTQTEDHTQTCQSCENEAPQVQSAVKVNKRTAAVYSPPEDTTLSLTVAGSRVGVERAASVDRPKRERERERAKSPNQILKVRNYNIRDD